MKVEEIELHKPYYSLMRRAKRCSRIVKSSGTSHFNNQTNRCGRYARFKLDGVAFCTQHAGEFALKHVMKND